ncbi:putative metal-binding motif-containing protein [Myxococcus landrumensis]|uniref:putative metal-binding motif-containing protein n=1 Tax=Myxococcus landrumensis TaxID=2813577 RepID=UPI001F506188|nr:putative metal-binding motif-containing protein [Myxococcus landrumus]
MLPLLVLAGCKKTETQGAVNVVVTYSGFKPGCLRVQITDTASAKSVAKDFTSEIQGDPGVGKTMQIGMVPPADWGTSLAVRVGAFEKSCEGKEVVNNSGNVTVALNTVQTVTLSLQATDADKDGYVDVLAGGSDCKDDNEKINPGAEERCNDTDDNCDGVSDDVHFKLNQACEVSADCKGISRCDPTTQAQYCDTPAAQTVYPDADGDGYGQKDSTPRIVCGGIPTGYTAGQPSDCRDDLFSINPGTEDLCDGEDTNCDGNIDERFPTKGQSCTNLTNNCEGTQTCSANKQSLDCVTPTPPKWYLDEDGDGYGTGAAVESCGKPAGAYVPQGGDCDDGNPYTNPGATEICDGVDNTCDGIKETTAQCPGSGTPEWVSQTVEGGSNWLAASSWGTKTTGGIWVTGNNVRRARLTYPETTFTVTSSTNCGSQTVGGGSEWTAVWSDPSDGRAWLGTSGGYKAYQTQGATNCTFISDDDVDIFGLAGLRTGSGLTLYGATASSSSGDGAAFTWNGTGAPTYNIANNPLSEVFDVHAHSPGHVLVVGGVNGNPRARIFRLDPATGLWNPEAVQSPERLRGVWIVNDKVAFAVGDAGHVVRKTNGTQWLSAGRTPDNHSLTSVIAFGANSAYTTCTNGHIYRFDGSNWTRVHNGSGKLNDITGSGPDDIWAVGNNGRIVHWPAWP